MTDTGAMPKAKSRELMKKKRTQRPKRQKVSKACVFCQRSHMSCDDQRPCQRCIKRNIAHLCRDKDITDNSKSEAKKTKIKGEPKNLATASIEPAVSLSQQTNLQLSNEQQQQPSVLIENTNTSQVPGAPISPLLQQPQQLQQQFQPQVSNLPISSDPVHVFQSQHPVQPQSATMPSAGHIVGVPPGGGSLAHFHLTTNTAAPGSHMNGSVSDTARRPSLAPIGPDQTTGSISSSGIGGISSLGGGIMSFNSNPLLLFGNDIAGNEFSALNEFLDSLQRGLRSAGVNNTDGTIIGSGLSVNSGSDRQMSNPPSGSPSIAPSNKSISSPALESPNPRLPPISNTFGQQSGGSATGSIASGSIPHYNQIAPQIPQNRVQCLPTISQLMSDGAGEKVTQKERFFLTAADPNDGTSEDKLRQVINAKYEAGFLKPYNYVSGYTRMQQFIETNLSQANIIRILSTLDMFRPTFRSIAQSLTDIDLLLVEEGFERLLLDYDNVFNSFGIPACLWRRTGEIYKANREFADLVGVPLSYFHEGKVCIYELMTEDSTVNYWEKYANIAFDATQKAVLTSCVLQTAASVRTIVHQDSTNGRFEDARAMSSSSIALKIGGLADQPSPSQPGRPVHCCFSFTIRRDKYKIPLAIIGNFMPIQDPN